MIRYAEDIVNKLQTLGSADQIALHYEGKGAKAKVCDSMACIVAEDAAGIPDSDVIGASVTNSSLWIRHEDDFLGADDDDFDEVSFDQDSPLGEFVTRFDHGDYPKLISEDSDAPLSWTENLD